MVRRFSVLAIIIAGTAAAVSIAENGAAGAQSGGFTAVSIDMDPSGNTATVLGPRQECREALPGATVTLDVTVEEISPSTPLFGYEYVIDFQGPTVVIIEQELIKIRSNPGSEPTNVSEPLPASGRSWTASVLDLNGNASAHESGSGALDRLTVEVSTDAAPGVYPFEISNMATVDQAGNAHLPQVTRNARLAIGVSCAGSTPLPDVTGSSAPTANGETDGPDGTISPDGGTSPTTDGGGSVTPTGASGAAGASGSPSAGADGQASPTPPASDDDGGGSGRWIALAVAIVVAGGAVGGWVAYRRYGQR